MADKKLSSKKIGRFALSCVNAALKPANLHLTRRNKPCLDLRDSTRDVIHASYLAGGLPFLLDVPLIDCRVMEYMAYPGSLKSGNPFTETLVQFPVTPHEPFPDTPLGRYYEIAQPTTGLERIGLSEIDSQSGLYGIPPAACPAPWSSLSPTLALERFNRWTKKENAFHGISTDPLKAGTSLFGPVSAEKLALELKRIFNLRDSIIRLGYRRSDEPQGDINVLALVDDDRQSFFVVHGHHRVATLSALGYEKIVVRVKGVIRSWEAERWPNVVNSLYTIDQALSVFNRILDGHLPSAYKGKV